MGCATVPGPSTAGVETKINNAQTSNSEAQRYNDLAGNAAKRVEAKGNVILKYWNNP